MADTNTAQVRVTKPATGHPIAEISVPSKISAPQLAGLMQQVTTNERVMKLAGLPACACKSGLDIRVIDMHPEVVEFQV